MVKKLRSRRNKKQVLLDRLQVCDIDIKDRYYQEIKKSFYFVIRLHLSDDSYQTLRIYPIGAFVKSFVEFSYLRDSYSHWILMLPAPYLDGISIQFCLVSNPYDCSDPLLLTYHILFEQQLCALSQ